MSEKNTAWLLAQWALWQREGVGLRLTTKNPLASVSRTACDCYLASEICDDDALRVDRAMAELKTLSNEYYKILFLSFVLDYSDRQVALRMSLSRRAAAQLYEEAYCWIDSKLNC